MRLPRDGTILEEGPGRQAPGPPPDPARRRPIRTPSVPAPAEFPMAPLHRTPDLFVPAAAGGDPAHGRRPVPSRAWTPDVHAGLLRLKQPYDPADLLRFGHTP